AGSRRNERRRARSETVTEQCLAPLAEKSARASEVRADGNGSHNYQLVPRSSGERRREPKQRGQRVLLQRRVQDGSLRCGHADEIEGRILPEDPLLELVQQWARLNAELLDERAPRRLVRRKSLCLT